MFEVCLSSHVDPCTEAFKQNFLPPTWQVWLPWLYASVFDPNFLPVCLFSLNVNKSCVHDIFPESPLNTDTQVIQTLLHVSPVSLLTGFHCIFVEFICTSVLFKKVLKLCNLNFLTNTLVKINSKLNEQSHRIFFLPLSSIHEGT